MKYCDCAVCNCGDSTTTSGTTGTWWERLSTASDWWDKEMARQMAADAEYETYPLDTECGTAYTAHCYCRSGTDGFIPHRQCCNCGHRKAIPVGNAE